MLAPQQSEFENHEREPLETEVQLPKISQVQVLAKEESARNEGVTLDAMQKMQHECEDKLRAMVKKEEERDAILLDPLVAGRQVQLELSLLQTMQKLLLQLKMLETMPRTQASVRKYKEFLNKLAQKHPRCAY